MIPPTLTPGAIFTPPPIIPSGPPQFAPPYAPIFYWPYPSPPVSPTNYYNPGNVGGISPITQQATLVNIKKYFFNIRNTRICIYLKEPRC